MLRILILNWKDLKNPDAGGAEVIVFQLARRLVRDGHAVTLVSRAFPGALPEEVLNGVRVIRRGGRFSVYLQAWSYYRRCNPKPDLVLDMVNTLCWFTPLYVPAAQRILYVNQLAREVLLLQLPWPLSQIAYASERLQFLLYRKTTVLCYSESTKADLIQFGLPEKNVQVFPLGVDHAQYRPGTVKSPTPLFIFVARLVYMKRADLCVRAMRIVCDKRADARLILIGRGPEEHALLQLITDLGLQNSVTLRHRDEQFLSDAEQQAQKVFLMQKAWALLLPSVKEGWGLVVTEAGACATPAIVSNVTGLRDAVRPDETGLIVSAQPTPEELAAAMLRLIEDPDRRTRLSAGARAFSAKFDWEKSYTRFRELLLRAQTLRK